MPIRTSLRRRALAVTLVVALLAPCAAGHAQSTQSAEDMLDGHGAGVAFFDHEEGDAHGLYLVIRGDEATKFFGSNYGIQAADEFPPILIIGRRREGNQLVFDLQERPTLRQHTLTIEGDRLTECGLVGARYMCSDYMRVH